MYLVFCTADMVFATDVLPKMVTCFFDVECCLLIQSIALNSCVFIF